jgi:hypothetical protein
MFLRIPACQRLPLFPPRITICLSLCSVISQCRGRAIAALVCRLSFLLLLVCPDSNLLVAQTENHLLAASQKSFTPVFCKTRFSRTVAVLLQKKACPCIALKNP